jgi:hypothetical protein
MINTTKETSGRFANHFFRNLAVHFLSKNNQIKFDYSYERQFFNLGIILYKTGANVYSENLEINDNNFFELIKTGTKINKNIFITKCGDEFFAQTKEFASHLKDYIYQSEQKNIIVEKNLFKHRYNNNNDVFIHIRLGDTIHYNPGYIYYDTLLSQLKFDRGYISSDSITHHICVELIKKYNLIEFTDTEVKTVMFASTCKNIILSNGTFSWLIGLFGFYSTIYYPKIKTIWHGDIFIFPEWNEISF